MPRKSKHGAPLTAEDTREFIDLYKWGARMCDLQVIYDRNANALRRYLVRYGVTPRPNGRPKPTEEFKSIRRNSPDDVVLLSDQEAVDQPIRAYAHALQVQRIEARRLGASIGSCLEGASVDQSASARIDIRLLTHE